MRFECQPGCTACCQHKGFVYLTEDDIARAARFLGMPAALFEKRYIYRTKNLRRLRIPRGGLCRFLRADGCSIHPAKPAWSFDMTLSPSMKWPARTLRMNPTSKCTRVIWSRHHSPEVM